MRVQLSFKLSVMVQFFPLINMSSGFTNSFGRCGELDKMSKDITSLANSIKRKQKKPQPKQIGRGFLFLKLTYISSLINCVNLLCFLCYLS